MVLDDNDFPHCHEDKERLSFNFFRRGDTSIKINVEVFSNVSKNVIGSGKSSTYKFLRINPSRTMFDTFSVNIFVYLVNLKKFFLLSLDLYLLCF